MHLRFVHNAVALFQHSDRVSPPSLGLNEMILHEDRAYTIVDIEHWSRKDGGDARYRLETTIHLELIDDEHLKLRRARHLGSGTGAGLKQRY